MHRLDQALNAAADAFGIEPIDELLMLSKLLSAIANRRILLHNGQVTTPERAPPQRMQHTRLIELNPECRGSMCPRGVP